MSFLYRASRALPKSVVRPLTSSLRQSIRSSRTGFLQSSFKAISRPTYSAFSTSCRWREATGDSDLELSAKFGREQELEQESRDSFTLPAHLQDFITNSSFDIEDIPGSGNVILSREYNTETIKVEFSIDSINDPLDETEMPDDDEAFEDEMDIAPKGKRTINQSGKSADIMVEDSIAPSDRDEEAAAGDEPAGPAYPVQLKITITKPSTGTVQIAASVEEGMVRIEQVNYYPDTELADPLTHEDYRKQSMIYAGPPFENLDTELQGFLERYLEERGIDTSLASFVPDYVDFKEQREYVQWLESKWCK
jgi:complement component 1 Q subcomponent-binding protein, mitochondrial